MRYSALEHLTLCLAAQNSWESSRPSKWTIEQGTVLKYTSRFTKRRKLYRMLPDLRESESNLCSHTINEHKLASYHNKVAAIQNFFTVERLFSPRNWLKISILTSEQSFFYLPFANNEKNPASFLDIRPHVLVVAECEHPPHILIYSHYVQIWTIPEKKKRRGGEMLDLRQGNVLQ